MLDTPGMVALDLDATLKGLFQRIVQHLENIPKPQGENISVITCDLSGPMQPDDKQCGYYVMRFMREIITEVENATSSTFQLSSLFKGVRTYSQAQLNEVREEWAECVIKHVLD
ncbi:hypothetical protein C2S52_007113 [Perilla frutescens var. hirtella]|nr:hypothetical protein C2S51_008745 [Perilla frutescens var. frutescens]KAH6787561.1 hypothetical protein C2S52_007113 [Perilla frutescens var. hirtella]